MGQIPKAMLPARRMPMLAMYLAQLIRYRRSMTVDTAHKRPRPMGMGYIRGRSQKGKTLQVGATLGRNPA